MEDQEKLGTAAEQSPASEITQDNTAGEKKNGKRWQKLLRRILLVVLVVAVVLVVVLNLFLDRMVAGAARTIGPRVTGTPVELEGVKLNLLQGRVELVGFKVGNPPGYQKPDAFVLNSFVCRVQPGSLFSDKIVVDEVLIDGMVVDFEPNIVDGSNLTVIQKNVEKFSGGEKAGAPAAGETTDTGKKAEKKVVIRLLRVTGVGLSVGSAVGITLPEITLKNLGEGRSMGEVIEEFYVVLMRSVSEVASNELLKATGEGLKKLGDDVGQAGSDLGNSLNKTGGDLGKDVNKAVDKLKQLF